MVEGAESGDIVVPVFLGQREIAPARVQAGTQVAVDFAGRDEVSARAAPENGLLLQFLQDVAAVVVPFDEEEALAFFAEVREHYPCLEKRERRQAEGRIAREQPGAPHALLQDDVDGATVGERNVLQRTHGLVVLIDFHPRDGIGREIVGHCAIASAHQVHSFHVEFSDGLPIVLDAARGRDRNAGQLLEQVAHGSFGTIPEGPGRIGKRIAFFFNSGSFHPRRPQFRSLLRQFNHDAGACTRHQGQLRRGKPHHRNPNLIEHHPFRHLQHKPTLSVAIGKGFLLRSGQPQHKSPGHGFLRLLFAHDARHGRLGEGRGATDQQGQQERKNPGSQHYFLSFQYSVGIFGMYLKNAALSSSLPLASVARAPWL